MRRHLIGIVLAIVMVAAMFFVGGWGYVRLLRLPAAKGAPLSALPAQGGSLLSNGNVLVALGAVAVTALLAGVLITVPRISPLAAGLPGLFAAAWQALFLVSVHRVVGIIPLRGHAFGAGWEALLFNGILGAVGLMMIIPLFVPSRWRGSDSDQEEITEADVSEATGYMADLKATMGSRSTQRIPAGVASGAPQPGMPQPGAPQPGMPGPGQGPGRGVRPGGAPTAANRAPGGPPWARMTWTGPFREVTRGGEPRGGAPRMRPRPYRRSDGNF